MQKSTRCVISEQTPAAFRRTPKGRRQTESRHSSQAYLRNAPHTPNRRDSRTLSKLCTAPNDKNFPKSTRTMRNETTLCHEKAGALGGSSRREWEVWRERDASFKRRPSPSKVSLKPSDTSPLRATRANRRRGRRLTRFSRSGRRREHGNASQHSRACRLWRDSRP